MTQEDGNVQDISVHDKDVAALGATAEAQDTDALPRVIVPMGAFHDPHNPYAQSLSVNLPLSEAPVKHSDDYGGVEKEYGDHETPNTASLHSAEAREYQVEEEDGEVAVDLPEDRSTWLKKDWQAQATAYGLATSGNTDKVKSRVKEHESAQEERVTFEKETHELGREDLDKLAAQYDIKPEEYSKKEDLAAAVIAAEYDEDVPVGDKHESQ
jgi:hypothetical protein